MCAGEHVCVLMSVYVQVSMYVQVKVGECVCGWVSMCVGGEGMFSVWGEQYLSG